MADALAGKVALVTGASRGIGRAIAIRLAGLGARVAINFRSEQARAEETKAAIAKAGGPEALLLQGDVGHPAEAKRLVEQTLERLGRLDVLVNNAAIQRSALLHKMTDEDWQQVLDVNLGAVFHLCRAALPSMLAAGEGHIVNIASASSYVAQKGAASYVASKHGLIGLTKALALETASKGIRVNAVAPGITETDLVTGLTEQTRAKLLALVPQGRMGSPDEVADMVAFVVTQARYSTGNVFHVSGGVVMG